MSSSSEQQHEDAHKPLPGLTIQDLEQMSDEEFWNYARQRAKSVPEPLSHAEYVECKLDDMSCLIPLRGLAEVLPPPHRLSRLPDVPAWMAGIMSWRDQTIAVVDLKSYLQGVQSMNPLLASQGTLLIASHAHQTLGLLVTSLGFTSTIRYEQIAPPTYLTGFVSGEQAGLIEGIYEDLPILDIATLLTGLVQQIGKTTSHG
jgi:chemotaxis signal transduction protein